MVSRLVLMAVLALCVAPSAAQAEEQLLVLWPKQRAAHQEQMDDNAVKYLARGQSYIDHLYATGGEEEMPAPEGFMDEPLEVSDTVPVNVNEVADIIKENDPTLSQ